MSLEEIDNQWSNFIIVSSSGTKKIGEPVLYGDAIHLQSLMDKDFWLNIENLQEGQLFNPLEVNASEFNAPIKLCNYFDYKTFEERELPQIKGRTLQTGEVVRIYNKSLNGFIGVKKSGNFTKILQTRMVEFAEEGKQNIVKMKQYYFDRIKSVRNIQLSYSLCVQIKEENQDQLPIAQKQKNQSKKKQDGKQEENDIFSERPGNVDIQTLWEVQKKDSFSSDFPTHDGLYCLKNLASGLYLCIHYSPYLNPYQNARFQNMYRGALGMDYSYILTFENTSTHNLIRFAQSKQSKKIQKDVPIQYSSSIIIQSFPELKNTDGKMTEQAQENPRSLVLLETKVKDKKLIQVECVSKLDKQSKDKYVYDLVSVSKDLRQITDRVSSLFPFLLDFYIFLQDWGHTISLETQELKYEYKQAFDNQKMLFNKVLEFSQCIDNLEEFLKVDDFTLQMRQDVIRDSSLLTLLILILQQIDFKIYGSTQTKEKGIDKNQSVSDRTAQKIAQMKLQKTVSLIYKNLISCIKGNSKSCSFLISSSNEYLSFFLKQLNKYPSDVKYLIREAIKWMEESDENEKKNIRNWCERISNVTSQNIGIQIFVMEILSLSMVNPLDEAIEENQKYCKNILFKESKEGITSMSSLGKNRDNHQYFSVKFEQKRLLSFKLVDKIPCVIFNLIGKNNEEFMKGNQKLKWITQIDNQSSKFQSKAFPFYSKSDTESNQSLFTSMSLPKYDEYVISILNFYAQMCKGRNIKVIRMLKSPEIGLDEKFIITCLKIFSPFEEEKNDPECKTIKNLDYYRCFLALYQETVLDVDPLIRISQSKVNSMVSESIRNFQISDKSYKLFHDFVLSENRKHYTVSLLNRIKDEQDKKGTELKIRHDDDEKESEDIRKYADKLVDYEENIYKVSGLIVDQLFNGLTTAQMINKNKIQESVQQQGESVLKTILQMLKIVHSRIDLGYNNLITNSHIMKNIKQIFLAFIKYRQMQENKIAEYDFRSPENRKELWIYSLLVYQFTYCNDSQLITKIVLEAQKIVQVLDILQRNLVIVTQIQQAMGQKITIQMISPSPKARMSIYGSQEIEMQNQKSESNEQVILLVTDQVEEKDQMNMSDVIIEDSPNQQDSGRKNLNNSFYSQSSYSKEKQNYDQKKKNVQIQDLEFDLFRQCNFTKLNRLVQQKQKNLKNLISSQKPVEVNELSIGTLLFQCLRYSLENPTLQQQLSDQLISYIQQSKTLMNLIEQIEIIDDQFELKLLRDLCGNLNGEQKGKHKSDTSEQITSKDMSIYAQKIVSSFKIMKDTQKNEQNDNQYPPLARQHNYANQLDTQSHTNLNQTGSKKNYLDQFTKGLDTILKLFKLESYDHYKKQIPTLKSKEEYFTQFQNLIRNTNFHSSILLLVTSSKVFIQQEGVEIKDDTYGSYKNLYSKIVEFLLQFIKNNEQNRLEVLPYFNKILKLALFQYDVQINEVINHDQKNRPLKIGNLCKQLLLDIKGDSEVIKEYIQIIFENIEKNKTDDQDKQPLSDEQLKKTIMRKQAICQYLNILLSLTTSEYNKCLKHNQQKIIDNLLNSKALKTISKPMTNHDIEQQNQKSKNKQIRYFTFKIHYLCFSVFSSCCKHHKLLIQEIRRIITSDSLKNALINKKTPFIIKHAYLKLLFNIYIQKDDMKQTNQEINENMQIDEIAEIIKEINKILSDENMNTYLEGLVKVNHQQMDEVQKIRTTISQGKKKNDFGSGILKDPSEYWRLVFDEGILHFLTDTYDEKISELEDDDSQKQFLKQSKQQQQQLKIASLKEQYQKIENNINNIAKILKNLESQFKNKSEFFNFEYQFRTIFNTNDIISTLKPNPSQEINIQDARQNGKNDQNEIDFYKYLRMFLMRNRLNIMDFCNNLLNVSRNLKVQSTKPFFKDVISSIINRNKTYVNEEQILEFLEQECKIRSQQKQISRDSEDNQETDFKEENIATVNRCLTNKFDKTKDYNIEQNKDLEQIFASVIDQNKITSDLDLNNLKDLLKMKLVKLSETNLKIIRKDILECEDSPDSPFKHYKEQNRVMEEVYITQILLDLIKHPDINLLLEEEDDDDQDPLHIKCLTESIISFIDATKQIFKNQTVYLIKFVRLLLELKQINKDIIENKTSKEKNITKKATKQVNDYQQMQTIVGKSKIHEQILSKIISSTYQNETIESLVLLVQLLNFGNSKNQANILNYLKQEKDVCLDFFSCLSDFFQSKSSYNLIQIKESRRKIPSQTVYFEVHSFLILKILQLFCENVNEDFQTFLRQQNDSSDIYSANTNVILETSNFLSFLLEDHIVSIDCKSILIRQCLETLVDFSTGAGENQQLICQNKRLFSFLQDKILDMKINFKKPKFGENPTVIERQENKIELFISCSKFLLSMVEGNHNTDSLQHILQHIQCEKMLDLIYKIYSERISPLQKNLVLEINCLGKDKAKHKDCNDSVCVSGYCTDYDVYLYEIGFKIFVIFLYLMESFEEDHTLDPFTKLLDIKDRTFDIFDFNGEQNIRQNFMKEFNKKLRQNKNEREEEQLGEQIKDKNLPHQLYPPNEQIPLLHSLQNEEQKQKTLISESQSGKKAHSEVYKIFSRKYKKYVPPVKFDVNFNLICSKQKQNEIKENRMKEYSSSASLKNVLIKQQTIANQEEEPVETQNQGPKNIFQVVLEAIHEVEIMSLNPRYYDFYKNQVGITEIYMNEKVSLIYFQKPFSSNFLSPFIKNHLIYESNRESDEDRLLFLLDNFMFYYKQMIYKQYWYQHKISWFMENWRTIKDIQYFFLLLIVFLQLFFLEGSIGDDSGETDLDNLTRALTVIQLILTAVVLIFCGIERFKISINRFTNADSWRKIQYLKENAGLTTETIFSKIQKFITAFEDNLNPTHYKKFTFFSRVLIYIFLIVSDIENFYHACYLGITIAGFFSKGPLVYGILLLDIVKRSASLKQIIKSITQNLWNIFIFSYLGVIVMYIYGIGGYYYFKPDFLKDEKAYNNTFIGSVASVINMGLRNGGGISESLKNVPSYTDPENEMSSSYFWGRYFYDLSFFIIINMLFIQIIFGIILDTFEELRKEQDEINEEVLNKCFVCSMSRGYIDSNAEGGWYQHIYCQHNAYHLVFFLICIARKDDTECNYVETYVKKQIEQKLVEFIPYRMSSDITDQEPVDNE